MGKIFVYKTGCSANQSHCTGRVLERVEGAAGDGQGGDVQPVLHVEEGDVAVLVPHRHDGAVGVHAHGEALALKHTTQHCQHSHDRLNCKATGRELLWPCR